MRRIIGFVHTIKPDDAGRTIFTLVDDQEQLIPCRSGAGYKSAKPQRGNKVAVTGNKIKDLLTGGDSEEFFYSFLEILPQPHLAERPKDKSPRAY